MKEKYYSKKKHHNKSGKKPYRKSAFKKIRLAVFSDMPVDCAVTTTVEADPNVYHSVSEALQDRVIYLVDQFLLETGGEFDEFTVHWEVEEDSGRIHMAAVHCDFSEVNALTYAPGDFKNPAVEYAKLFTKCYESQVLPVIQEYRIL